MFGEINFGFFRPLHFQVNVKLKSKFFFSQKQLIDLLKNSWNTSLE